jgi:hypothetical protein
VVDDPINSDFMDAPRGVHTLICPAFSITGRKDANRLLEFHQTTKGGIKLLSLTGSIGVSGSSPKLSLKLYPPVRIGTRTPKSTLWLDWMSADCFFEKLAEVADGPEMVT